MMTPERAAPPADSFTNEDDTPMTPIPPTSAVDVSVDNYNDEDVKDVENQVVLDDVTTNTISNNNTNDNDNNTNINSTINDSMTSENCKIINESDQTHTPCPDPEGANTRSMQNSMDGVNLMVPDSPNLTPVKLDDDLKEQDTFTSSPANSREPLNESGSSDGSSGVRPLSRGQNRMRVFKCYGLVAVVVLICAIGIPLGAVMLFKNKNNETSFDATSTASTADGSPTMPEQAATITTTAPVVETSKPAPVVTKVPLVDTEASAAVADDDDDDFVPAVAELDTEAPAVDTEVPAPVVAEPWDVDTDDVAGMDAIMNVANNTETLDEKNVTTAHTSPMDEDVATEMPATEDPEEVVETAAPTAAATEEAQIVTTAEPTAASTVRAPTNAPTTKATNPPGPDRTPVYFELVEVTEPSVLQDTSSPQALSYLWLVEQDQVLPVPSGRKLIQRYVLVVMDHIFNSPSRPVLSQADLDECDWTGIVCDEETGDVLEVNWGRQNLNGVLVPEMRHLGNLTKLDLSENEMVGTLEYLYEVKTLKEIYLNDNQFSGPLSEQIGLITNIEKLFLGKNQLTGNIPMSLRSPVGEAKPLKWLVLSHNKFTGYLPPDWRMRNLFYLDLGYNMLQGPLPNDWDSNMVRLRHLYLDHNSFTGLVPGYFSNIGNGRIKQLNLNSNFLEGEVPVDWENLDQVINLNFEDNNITTPIDPRVCELSVFEQGNLVELRVDCDICTCDTLCHYCD